MAYFRDICFGNVTKIMSKEIESSLRTPFFLRLRHRPPRPRLRPRLRLTLSASHGQGGPQLDEGAGAAYLRPERFSLHAPTCLSARGGAQSSSEDPAGS